MTIGRIACVTAVLLLVACATTVELQYSAAPTSNDYETLAKQANEHFEYVQLSRTYIKVAPSNDTANSTPKKTGATAQAAAQAPDASATPRKLTAGSKSTNSATGTPLSAQSKSAPTASTSGTKTTSAQTGAAATAQDKLAADNPGANSGDG